ncbi:AraC family transcriptional regulator ligand-binding domain-containing protein [Methylocella sp.]|uniref:AraC family transcriptional regulator ligand-binding domain-containing protein n=1 Tax=Methylocella sp. TaxID=1978226 RepID=UPI0037830246
MSSLSHEVDVPEANGQAPVIPIYRAGLGRLLPPGHVRIAVAGAVPDLMRQFGLPLDDILRKAALPCDVFDHPDNAIPFDSLGDILSFGVRSTGREDFGLLIGERAGASSLGLSGFLLQQAVDVRTALGDLVRYLHHHDRGASPFVEVDGVDAFLGYSISHYDGPGRPFIYDGALAIGRNIMAGLCGPQFSFVDVSLSRPKPSSPARYAQFFGAPVKFDAERSALRFRASWLDHKLPKTDALLRHMLQEQLDLLEAEEAGNATEQVRRLLRAALIKRPMAHEDVCALLNVGRRTLTRRLAAEGVTFQEIHNEILFEIARRMLAQPARRSPRSPSRCMWSRSLRPRLPAMGGHVAARLAHEPAPARRDLTRAPPPAPGENARAAPHAGLANCRARHKAFFNDVVNRSGDVHVMERVVRAKSGPELELGG